MCDHKSVALDRLLEPTLHLKFYLIVFPSFSNHVDPASVSQIQSRISAISSNLWSQEYLLTWYDGPFLTSATQEGRSVEQ